MKTEREDVVLKWLKAIFAGRENERSEAQTHVPPPTLEHVLARIASLRRVAFVPRVVEEKGPPTASKLGGVPWLETEGAWPCCGVCARPMQCFLQLNLEELPARPEGCPERGLVQLFYCTNDEEGCEDVCEGWAPFGRSSLARIVENPGEGFAVSESPVEDAFPEQHIVGWDPEDDYPNFEECLERGIEITFAENEVLAEAGFPRPGDKLLGWPFWVQSIEYPSCPDCGGTMTLLFQIDTECGLPYMWGDSGCAHLTICPEHPGRLGFGWACY